jgi:hypothetical protein
MEILNMFHTQKIELKTMKIRNITLALTLLASLFIAGCEGGPFCMSPTGEVVTQAIALEAIDGIELDIAGNVTLHQDSVQQIKVTGHQNIIDNIGLQVVNGVWKIRFDECVRRTGTLEIEIWMPTLRKVTLAGSGNIEGVDAFTGGSSLEVNLTGSGDIDLQADAPTVQIELTGSGSIDLATNADELDATITGSGDIDLAGSCRDEDLKITGSGNIHAYDMPAVTAAVEITGSGNCEVQVSEHLDVQISGSGSVYYKGDASVDTHITGSGRVKHVD